MDSILHLSFFPSNTEMGSNLNTATNLRWRARVTKEAVLNDDDDSYYYSPEKPHSGANTVASGDRWEVIDSSSKDIPSTAGERCSYQSLSKILLSTIAATAVGSSVYAQTEILSVMITNTTLQLLLWYVISLSCTLSSACAFLALWQHAQMRKLGSIRSIHNRLRASVRSLGQQNERTRRNLTLLDGSINRLGHVEHELQKFTNNSSKDTQRLVNVLKEHKRMQQDLQQVVRKQVQEQILAAVLQTDSNRDCSLSTQELERLIVRLKSISGLVVREEQLRSLLLQNRTEGNELPLSSVLNLLRQVGADASKPSVSPSYESPTRSRGLVNWEDQDNDDGTVFRFCPQQLVSSNEPLIKLS